MLSMNKKGKLNSHLLEIVSKSNTRSIISREVHNQYLMN